MEIKVNESLKSVEVVFENPENTFQFNLGSEVKLTDFVIYVSDLEKEISISPVDYEAFQAENEIQSKEVKKLVEYIYKIIDSFNESIRIVNIETEKTLQDVAVIGDF